MSFGVYIHIPYCLQRCTYCDFATYEHSKIMPPDDYIRLLKHEIKTRRPGLPTTEMDTIYFGGGTPSLLRPDQIITVIQALENEGLRRSPDCEITIEINPATLSTQAIADLVHFGVNRFSVGAQTFNDPLLKSVHREHGASQTRETLTLLQSQGLNYSADLLFALPGQSLEILKKDVRELLDFRPPHISPYCLTVPEGHVLSKGRPLEDTQLEMFRHIDAELRNAGYERYEISNYALPGFHSRHNSLYWEDQNYWGIGLSAHSYLKQATWGVRFWNAANIGVYEEQIRASQYQIWPTPYAGLPAAQTEVLAAHEALTDFCHTSLRKAQGLNRDAVLNKFGEPGWNLIAGPLEKLTSEGLLNRDASAYFLSQEGVFVSNSVFRELTFLPEEWLSATKSP